MRVVCILDRGRPDVAAVCHLKLLRVLAALRADTGTLSSKSCWRSAGEQALSQKVVINRDELDRLVLMRMDLDRYEVS